MSDLDPPSLQNDHLRLLPFHFDADPVPAFHFDADPGDRDPYPAFYFDVDPDQASQNDADQEPQHWIRLIAGPGPDLY